MKLTTLSDGSILATWDNDRNYINAEQYVCYRDRLWVVSARGALLPAFGGLRRHPGEPIELAVRRGLNGERGTPAVDWPHVARMTLLCAVLAVVLAVAC